MSDCLLAWALDERALAHLCTTVSPHGRLWWATAERYHRLEACMADTGQCQPIPANARSGEDTSRRLYPAGWIASRIWNCAVAIRAASDDATEFIRVELLHKAVSYSNTHTLEHHPTIPLFPALLPQTVRPILHLRWR